MDTRSRAAWVAITIACCVLGLVLFFIATVIILSLIPVYLNSRNVEQISNSDAPSMTASYLINDGSDVDVSNIDRTRSAKSFAQGFSLSNTNSLGIDSVSQDTVVASTRRKRSIQCNSGLTNVNGKGLIFQFRLIYPQNLLCQTDSCKTQTYLGIYERFQKVHDLSVELAGKIISLKLCSLGLVSYTSSNSSATTTTTTSSVSNVWQMVSNMSSVRYQPSNALNTAADTVIISGSSSIYDFPTASVSAIDTFAKNGSLISSQNLTVTRNFHSTNHLSSSNIILFAGGIDASNGMKLNTAELLNLTTNKITSMTMSSIRLDHQSTVINSTNKIILIGGTNENGDVSNSGDVFDGTSFTAIANQMTYGRRYHTITYLPTINKILIIGGETLVNCGPKILNTIEFYDITSNMFDSSLNITMSTSRSLHTATYLPEPHNQVLIIGGSSNGTNTLNTFEIFNVSTLSFVQNGTIQSARAAHTATLLKNSTSILIVGGYSSNQAINVTTQSIAPCEMFDVATKTSTLVTNMNVPRALHTAALLSNDKNVLCCGGVDSQNNALASCERYVS